MSNLNEITAHIIAAAMRVHSTLGPGLLESTYEVCLVHELTSNGLLVERQKPLPVFYAREVEPPLRRAASILPETQRYKSGAPSQLQCLALEGRNPSHGQWRLKKERRERPRVKKKTMSQPSSRGDFFRRECHRRGHREKPKEEKTRSQKRKPIILRPRFAFPIPFSFFPPPLPSAPSSAAGGSFFEENATAEDTEKCRRRRKPEVRKEPSDPPASTHIPHSFLFLPSSSSLSAPERSGR
jgi:hypothetical protein